MNNFFRGKLFTYFAFTLWLLLLSALPLFSNLYSNSFSSNKLGTSFEIDNGLILVEASMDGKKGWFILDTGSPYVIIHNTKNQLINTGQRSNQIELIGEQQLLQELSFAGIRKFNLEAFNADISHLKQIVQKPIIGIIGFNFFKDFEIQLDFEKQFITLAPQKFYNVPADWNLVEKIPINIIGHLPTIEVQIKGQKMVMGLDTGSTTNVLDESTFKLYAKGKHKNTSVKNVVGIDPEKRKMEVVNISSTLIKKVDFYDMEYILCNISNLGTFDNQQVDGLLGVTFFRTGKFSINYKTRTFSIWQ